MSGRRWMMALWLLAAGCGDRAPQVEVNTYVGPSHARADTQARRENAQRVAEAVLAQMMPPPPEPDELGDVLPDEPLHPPTNAEEFELLVQAVRSAPLDELGGPARRLAAADPAVWSLVQQELMAKRKTSKKVYGSVLTLIGGDIPNRYGHFERSWKKAHGYAVKLSHDWFTDLLNLRTGRLSRGVHDVYRDCVLQVALMHAAAGIGAQQPSLTGEVVATLLDVAYLHKGTFRDEVGRAVVGVGDEAIPYLLVESMTPPGRRKKDKREDVPLLRAEYAKLQLDKMDRLHPRRATDAVRDDPPLLARVLHAYGTVRPGEAAAVLLDYTDAEDPLVRRAARASFVSYVEGAPPPVRGRTIRLLGGGTGRALAHLSYRELAGLAIRERMEAEVPDRLEPECELLRADGSTDRKCQDQPERLTHVYLDWLIERREHADRQAVEQAMAEPDVQQRVVQLDRLLAGNPGLALGDRLVPVYREAAEAAQAEGNVARAGQLLRKAARLTEADDPQGGEALRVQALLAEASVPQLSPDGRRMLLSSAERLAPEDPRIATALSDLEHAPQASALTDRQRWTPVMGVVAGLWGLGLMGSWWRRRRR